MKAPRRTPEEMLGESLREAGVLVVVFYALSTFIKVGGVPFIEFLGAVVGLLFGAGLWLIGANVELKE